jgi:hypothetical protein
MFQRYQKSKKDPTLRKNEVSCLSPDRSSSLLACKVLTTKRTLGPSYEKIDPCERGRVSRGQRSAAAHLPASNRVEILGTLIRAQDLSFAEKRGQGGGVDTRSF